MLIIIAFSFTLFMSYNNYTLNFLFYLVVLLLSETYKCGHIRYFPINLHITLHLTYFGVHLNR